MEGNPYLPPGVTDRQIDEQARECPGHCGHYETGKPCCDCGEVKPSE